jgi:GNAT superfamily N-acetyltransferase
VLDGNPGAGPEQAESLIMDKIIIAPPRPEDQADWRRLYEGYATFYKMPMNDEIAARVWSWLHDPAHVLEALVARLPEGKLVGLAHFRALRGAKIADRLLEAMAALGRERGWTLIRWLTADNNYRARGVYDRLAKRTMWITYQMDL